MPYYKIEVDEEGNQGEAVELIAPLKRRKYHSRGGSINKYLIIDNKFLSEYLGVHRNTIRRWIKSGKLIPTNIDNIVSNKPIITEEKGEFSL